MSCTYKIGLAGLSALLACHAAYAADAATGSKQDDQLSEIVVTGTQIRGINPAGVQVIGVGEDRINELGASSGQDVLTSLPQVANMFQAKLAPGNNNPIFADRLPVSRPNLRNLPGITLTSVGFTLVLVDGHRMVPIGIQYAGIDADAVPASLLQRVEVMPDGASAIYGSDAVAGVINFITRDKFDGVRFNGHYGLADGYWADDANLTAGTHWSTGGIYASLSRMEHDWILGRDRDFIQIIDWNSASPTYLQPLGTNCANPNISFSGAAGARRLYPLTAPGGAIQPDTTNGGTVAGTATGGGNRCDTVDPGNVSVGGDQSFYPKQNKWSFATGLTQEFGERLNFDIRGFWNQTDTLNSGGPFITTATVAATNPNYRNVSVLGGPGVNYNLADAGATQQVLFNWAPVFGTTSRRATSSEWWQISPQLTWKASGDWQVRALGSYGKSDSRAAFEVLDARATTGVQARITSGLINPYNLSASAAGAFDNIVQVQRRYGKYDFTNARVIADGSLFHLPGGNLRTAVGAEYARTKLTQNLTNANFQFDAPASYTQGVKSVFGELQAPIVAESNARSGLHSLLLSASLRHDRYDDFGNTTNPSLGVTYEPVSWVKLRGNWNKSFTAPSPGDQIGKQLVSWQGLPGGPAVFPLPNWGGVNPFPASTFAFFLNQGTVGGVAGDPTSILPQTSKAWSLGLDFEPPVWPGLTFGGSYYNLTIDNLISGPGAPGAIISQYPGLVYCHSTVAGQLGAPSNSSAANCSAPLSPAEILKYEAAGSAASISASGVFPGGANADLLLPGGRQVAYVMDIRARNLGSVKAEGIDLHAAFQHRTGWGTIDASVSGNYQLGLKQNAGPGTPYVDRLEFDTAKWRWSVTAGTSLGGVRSQVTWDHTSGYRLKPGVGNSGGTPGTATAACTGACGQQDVKAFDTFDLFFKYDFHGQHMYTKDLSLALNVDNVFDTNPPVLMSGSGFANGFTLGRFFQLGLMKRF
jgi:iron complex outermembrane receptor protein